jgi:hypothetical protein
VVSTTSTQRTPPPPPRRLQRHRADRPTRQAIATLHRTNVISAAVGHLATRFYRSGHQICEKNDLNDLHGVDPPMGTPPTPWNRQRPMAREGELVPEDPTHEPHVIDRQYEETSRSGRPGSMSRPSCRLQHKGPQHRSRPHDARGWESPTTTFLDLRSGCAGDDLRQRQGRRLVMVRQRWLGLRATQSQPRSGRRMGLCDVYDKGCEVVLTN